MGNKRIKVVSESMFYTLMAFLHGDIVVPKLQAWLRN